jgi:predicted esterase
MRRSSCSFSGPVCSVGLEMYYSDLVENTSLPLDEAYAALPAFHGAPGYDPLPALTAGTTPTLWLLGADDRSIPVRNTIDALRTLSSSGKPYEWRSYPGLGHSLAPSAIWPDIEAWLRRRLK